MEVAQQKPNYFRATISFDCDRLQLLGTFIFISLIAPLPSTNSTRDRLYIFYKAGDGI
ncbi:MAG TPA: hypothetical protein V6D09_01905 [Leptolyngbyaceae cyanobacterium]